MSFNLSAIEQFGSGAAKAPPSRTSKFVPRARARPTQKPAENPALQPNDQAEKQQPRRTAESDKEPTTHASRPVDGDNRGVPAVQPQQLEDPAQPPEDAEGATIAAQPPATQNEAPPAKQSAALPATKEAAAGPPNEDVPDSQALAAGREGSAAPSPPPDADATGKELATVEPGPDDVGTNKARGSKKGTSGRSVASKQRQRMTTEEQAGMELNPGTHSIKMYVKRAVAQERLRQNSLKNQRAEEGAALEGSTQQRLPLEVPRTAGGSSAPVLEMSLVDGKLVPNEASMVVPAQAQPQYHRVLEYNDKVNNASYTNRMPSERWTANETEAFFRAVQCFGPNFELIAKLFPGRPRRALANKWRRESKSNPERIAAAYSGSGSVAGLKEIVNALSNAEMDEEGNAADLGLEATQLFETEAMVEEEAGEARAAVAADAAQLEREGEADEPVSFRKAKSRRKALPAQSLPAEQLQPPAQDAGKSGNGRKGRARASKRGREPVSEQAGQELRRSRRKTSKLAAEEIEAAA